MKKILVPIDFSKESTKALEIANTIAKKSGASIDVLHVVEPLGTDPIAVTGERHDNSMDQVFMIQLLEKVKGNMHKLRDDPKFSSGVDFNTHVAIGDINKTIIDNVSKNDVGMVVIGARGISEWDRMLIGSHTDKVIKNAACPVLVVHKDQELSDFKDLVFATNAMEDITSAAAKLKSLQEIFGMKLHLLRVVTINDFVTQSEAMADLHALAKAYGLEVASFNVHNDVGVEEGILNFSNEKKMDVISMITHHRSFLGYLVNGSVSADVANASKRPVLTLTA